MEVPLEVSVQKSSPKEVQTQRYDATDLKLLIRDEMGKLLGRSTTQESPLGVSHCALEFAGNG